MRAAGGLTAAAAYHWIGELYNRTPYEPVRDRYTDDDSLPIQHGLFYRADQYPDDHLLLDGAILRRRYDPDFLLIGPMNTDDAGHRHGGDSGHYRNAARNVDNALSTQLPGWLAASYQVIVTSDQGMNRDHTQRGVLPEERQVPLFVMGTGFSHDPAAAPRQTVLCGVLADLIGVTHHKPRNLSLLAP